KVILDTRKTANRRQRITHQLVSTAVLIPGQRGTYPVIQSPQFDSCLQLSVAFPLVVRVGQSRRIGVRNLVSPCLTDGICCHVSIINYLVTTGDTIASP